MHNTDGIKNRLSGPFTALTWPKLPLSTHVLSNGYVAGSWL